jgi:hypothetical protein
MRRLDRLEEIPSIMVDPSRVARPVIERFPERRDTIQRLLEQDAEFREMCLDYAEASQAFAHWSALALRAALEASSEQVADQYRILVYELEAEILEALVRDEASQD